MQTVLSFIIIFGALVFVHELGHLIFAKRAGILCREFAIGFGPKVLSFMKNETVYTIRLLPIGGFVRMAGEDAEMIEIKPGYRVGLKLNNEGTVQKIILNNKDKYRDIKVLEVEEVDLERGLFIRGFEDDDDQMIQTYKIDPKAMIVEDGVENQIAPWDRQFGSKKLGQRTMAIFAGPMMNFIFAIVIFTVLAAIQGVVVDDAKIGKLTSDGAAISAGLKTGDEVQSIDGAETSSWLDVQEEIQKHPGKEITFVVDRDGKTLEIPVTPKEIERDNQKIGVIGVYQPTEKTFLSVLTFGFTETYDWVVRIFEMLGKLITGNFSIDMLSGPVGIYVSTEEVAKSGVLTLMRWAGVLSINLGIMNLLPIPALDGGRLLFFGVEALRGKPLDRQKEGMVHFIGFALLMLLMLVVTWNDIQRFFL
ncbi:RIP metalloprotease RseP [Bacillus testis]|uniref:RIP metalloprotease RseP n=1 Tax=Bacillus testis TaxID=1622072 RepID=UPI00067F1632|nr:RIP metalloprotease RseP [Bacillus testis]